MQLVYEPFVERIRRVDIHAIAGNDVVVLEANPANAGLPRVRLEIECHPFLQYHGRIFGRRAEVRRLPWIDARAVTQAVQHVRIGSRENLPMGRAGPYFRSRMETA